MSDSVDSCVQCVYQEYPRDYYQQTLLMHRFVIRQKKPRQERGFVLPETIEFTQLGFTQCEKLFVQLVRGNLYRITFHVVLASAHRSHERVGVAP